MKRYGLLIVLGLGAIASIVVDIILKLDCMIFNNLSEMLFSLVTVIAGFWVTCYLLILEIFKDRYPIKLIKDKYLPQMKFIIAYIIYAILFGCYILIKQGGLTENIWFAISALLGFGK